MSNIKCTYHNGPFDVFWLRHFGFNCTYEFDTMLAHYLLDERQGTHNLKLLSSRYYNASEYADPPLTVGHRGAGRTQGGTGAGKTDTHHEDDVQRIWDTSDLDVLRQYNGADCDYTKRLTEDLAQEMKEEDPRLLDVLHKILIPAAELFIEMQEVGLLIDVEYLKALGENWILDMEDVEKKIHQFPGSENLNLNSPKQVSDYMFNVLELEPMVKGSNKPIGSEILARETAKVKNPDAQEFFRTQSSKQVAGTTPKSTGIFMLYYLGEQHEFPLLLLRHRLLAKRVGSYYHGIMDRLGSDNRLRASYRLHGTKTGRLSSSDPNLHGIPREFDIKRMFISDPGYTIIEADYSQAEVRMVAHFAKDQNLVQAMSEADIHTGISKQLFNLTDEDLAKMDPEEKKQKRRASKSCTFGILYGRSAKGLAPQLGCSKEEAEEFMEKFFKAMPEVQKWVVAQKQRAMIENESISLYGRRRRFDYWPEGGSVKNELLRQSVNAPIQSSVSDMTLLAMIRVIHRLRGEGIPTIGNVHIHDGYWFTVPDEYVQYAVDVTYQEMSDVGFETDVPFVCDVAAGKTWGDMHGAQRS